MRPVKPKAGCQQDTRSLVRNNRQTLDGDAQSRIFLPFLMSRAGALPGRQLHEPAAGEGSFIRTDQSALRQFRHLCINRFDGERGTTAALHAALHMPEDDSGRRDRGLGAVQDFDQSLFNIAIRYDGAGTHDHCANSGKVAKSTAGSPQGTVVVVV